MTEEVLPSSENLAFVESLLESYLADPSSVTPDWRTYFERITRSNGDFKTGPSFKPRSIFGAPAATNGAAAPTGKPHQRRADDAAALQYRVDALVRNYRVRGHTIADINPLGSPKPIPPELDPAYLGFTEEDMDREVLSPSFNGDKPIKVRDLIQRLRTTYCRSIGVQFMHIDNLTVREWIQHRVEGTENRLALSRDEQLRILTRLTDAVMFEEFIQRKFIGAKSFSLQGSESLIPLLDLAFEKAAGEGVVEIVVGMAHRGRLNALVNLMGKSAKDVLRTFVDADAQLYKGRGDVKYHLGHSGDWTTSTGKAMHLSLCFNPSHLEYVNPVAMGRLRAKMDREKDFARETGLCLQIHGDAAFAGEGITQETLNLSELEGYTVGGSLHVIVNNQIGFTTGPSQGRSTTYASDVAKMLQSPIFHVNGEDPEAVAQVVDICMDFRFTFKRDVVIDMYGYRRMGHNEGDEPAYTQPQLYDTISKRKSVREGYLEHLLQLGEVTREEADRLATVRRDHLEHELTVARSEQYEMPTPTLKGAWEGYKGGADRETPEAETKVSRAKLSEYLMALTHLPEGFHLHPKLERWMEARREMAEGRKPLDWAAGEALAYASLAAQGTRVRLTGQDSERGTFSHRHSVLHDAKNGSIYRPLDHVTPDQAPVEIYNSPLSEMGVMGFEYGYSLDYPDALVLWEAQFGDFNNAGQVIIDQFIASAENKWHRFSGLVLLLPHGMEGQGPEHSSARLERFLALSAEDNLFVVNLTTPAQIFHCLRRQVVRPVRKPLIVMTPKSLLRSPQAVSTLEDLADGEFQRVIPDNLPPKAIRKVLLCSGKIYYDLLDRREKDGRKDITIIRIEQLYPFPDEDLRKAMEAYAQDVTTIWVQEEPLNMGAWRYLQTKYSVPNGIGRPEAASPATGSLSAHRLEQQEIIDHAFAE